MFRCDIDGLLRCTDAADGKTLWDFKLPFDGYPTPLTDGGVIVGTIDGRVVRLDKSGKTVWSSELIDLQERPGQDYGAFIQEGLRRDADNTGELYPINHDLAGDYDKVFRMGTEQLKNGSFETKEAWTSTDNNGVWNNRFGRQRQPQIALPSHRPACHAAPDAADRSAGHVPARILV